MLASSHRLIFLVALSAWLALSACSSQQTQTKVKAVPEVVMKVRTGAELRVKVEIARTEPERAKGLMFRDKLEGGTGMLFLFEHPEKLRFWMKNTYIPLDMVFFDEQRRVVYVEESAEPLTLNGRGPNEDAQFVLEVPGGWARAHGIDVGVVAQFLAID